MKQYLLFDLDGTLTDPKVGITTCVQYALASLGIEEPDLDKLEAFIGPPLKDSFREFYHLNEEQVEQAVAKYRERFQDIGLFENEIYKGVPDMLKTLQSKGIFLAVASSKPTVFVKRILEHFHIDKYFKVVVGSELDGTRVNKDEVVREALSQLFGDKPIQYDKVYMIGDRRFDMEGAHAIGVEGVGVTYGYGSMEELKAAKADYIVRSVEELQKFLLRGSEELVTPGNTKPKQKGFFQTAWVMLFPFLMFMLVRQVASHLLSLIMIAIGANLTGSIADFLVIKDEAGELIGFTGNASSIMSALSFMAGAAAVWKTAKAYIEKAADDMKLSHLKKEPGLHYVILFFTTVGAVLGLNLLLELTQITNKSEAYQAVLDDQYSAVLWIGLLCYGIITPIAEEIMFRGIMFNCLKRGLTLKLAILVSSFLFGVYHGNSVQGVYAFVMGCLMAYAYEYFGSFYVAVGIHMLSNLLAYSLTSTVLINTAFVSWPVCIIFLAIAGVGIELLSKKKKLFGIV